MKKSEKIQTVILGVGALVVALSTVLSQRKIANRYEEFVGLQEDEDN